MRIQKVRPATVRERRDASAGRREAPRDHSEYSALQVGDESVGEECDSSQLADGDDQILTLLRIEATKELLPKRARKLVEVRIAHIGDRRVSLGDSCFAEVTEFVRLLSREVGDSLQSGLKAWAQAAFDWLYIGE